MSRRSWRSTPKTIFVSRHLWKNDSIYWRPTFIQWIHGDETLRAPFNPTKGHDQNLAYECVFTSWTSCGRLLPIFDLLRGCIPGMCMSFHAYVIIGNDAVYNQQWGGRGGLWHVPCSCDACAANHWQQAKKGLLLLWRECKLSHSRIPSYQCGHDGNTLISYFWIILKESLVLFGQIKNDYPIMSTSFQPIFRQQLIDLLLAQCPRLLNVYIDVVWSDKASALTGHLWEVTFVPLFVSTLRSRCFGSPPFSPIAPETRMTSRARHCDQRLSTCVTFCGLASCLR